MTNEEKAKEIAKDNREYYYEGDIGWGAKESCSEEECYESAMQAMQWKEQQLIDKCKEFCDRQTIGEYYNRRGVFQIDKYIDDMLNFIKGE